MPNERTIFVSPYTEGYIDALDFVAQLKLPIYDTILQSGATRFVKLGKFREQSPEFPEYLDKRICTLPDPQYTAIGNKMDELFKNYEAGDCVKLRYFLNDILYSAYKGFSLAAPLPNLDKIEERLPPKIYYPIKNFFNSIQSLSADGLCLHKSIKQRHVKVLEEILESRLYELYVNAHSTVVQESNPSNRISRISEISNKLVESYENMVLS